MNTATSPVLAAQIAAVAAKETKPAPAPAVTPVASTPAVDAAKAPAKKAPAKKAPAVKKTTTKKAPAKKTPAAKKPAQPFDGLKTKVKHKAKPTPAPERATPGRKPLYGAKEGALLRGITVKLTERQFKAFHALPEGGPAWVRRGLDAVMAAKKG